MRAPTSPASLAAMPTDWARALAVVAHPDDIEYGGTAAVARWTDEGHTLDISATFDRGIASLQAHAAYLQALGDPIQPARGC